MMAEKTVLNNGVRVIQVPLAGAIACTVLILVSTGSKYETKRVSGISHFLEHMLFKGTAKRPRAIDISSAFDSLGAQYNAYTAQEYTGYHATVLPKFASAALDILSDMVLNATLPAGELEKEKGVIIEEINMYEDIPMKQVEDVSLELLFGDQPAGWNIAGTRESVRGLARQDFVDYQAAHYSAGAITVVLAGKFDPRVIEQVKDIFGVLPAQDKPEKVVVSETQAAPALAWKTKKSDQTHLVLATRAYPVGHDYHYALELLNTVLGGGMSSRLFHRIREEMGAAYYVRSSQDAFTDHGHLSIAVGADNRRVAEVVGAIIEECARLKQELVPEVELRRAKDALMGDLFLGLETTAALAGFYGLQETLGLPLRGPDEIAEKIEAVGVSQIRDLAQAILRPESLNLALVGPGGERGEALKERLIL